MKKLMAICTVVTMFLVLSSVSLASVTVDFDAVALRPANDGSGYGTITEYANGNGVHTSVPEAGQKVYYGSDAFNGWALSDVSYVEFTYKRPNGGNNPYTNMVVTDGSGNYGVISSQGGYEQWVNVGTEYTEKRMRYYFAGNSGNQQYGFRFYEPSPDDGSWSHGTNLTWADLSSWSILGAGDQRPLYSGENGVARGPVDDGLAIMWGDSAANYLGIRDIYDVTVVGMDGTEYVAGVVPVPGAVLLGGIGVGLVGWMKRRKTL